MYSELTHGVRVVVEPQYVPEQSQPESQLYIFSYHVQIFNESPELVQLISRHWIVTDGKGKVHEVKGPGVVGRQPKIAPGTSFEYLSYCPLPTPTGNMRGSYEILCQNQETQKIRIPLFFLRDLRNLTPSQAFT